MERKLIIESSPAAIQAVWSELTALLDDLKVDYKDKSGGAAMVTSCEASRDALRNDPVTIELG